jgi:Asp-tRNA(Asn)/Glu-tRNA(Gln) amidotransferase A subunit family amidase
MERARRTYAQPLCARPQSVRIKLRYGSGVSANLCVAGVGTETDGSVVCPSSANGLAGLKPTVGLVSRSGIVPISHSQDTAGPMARTVRDVAILLSAMAGADAEDTATAVLSATNFFPTTPSFSIPQDSRARAWEWCASISASTMPSTS